MILEMALSIYFVASLLTLILHSTCANYTYDSTKTRQSKVILINIIFIIIFVISLYKQVFINDYILMFLIFDSIVGALTEINNYGKDIVTVETTMRIYYIVSSVVIIAGILFIWL